MTFAGVKKVFREIHSENGVLSWGRVAATFSTLAAFVWVTKQVWHTGTMPDLGGPSLFSVAPYAAARAAATAQSFSNNPPVLTQVGANPAPPSMLPVPPAPVVVSPVVVAPAPVVVSQPVQGPSPDEV